MRSLVLIAVVMLAAQLQACVAVQDINPFTPRPLSSTEVVQSQFPHIFVPKDLALQTQRSFLMQGSVPYGMQAYSGNFALADLGRFMQNGLTREGWKLQTSLMRGDRALQTYDRQGMRAVLVYVRQTTSTSLDIWVGNAQNLMEWAVQDIPYGSNASPDNGLPVYEDVPNAAPAAKANTSSGTGGVQERALP